MSEGPSVNQPIVIEIRDWNLELASIKLCISCITIIVFTLVKSQNMFLTMQLAILELNCYQLKFQRI